MTDAALRARYLDALGIDRYLLRHPPATEAVATESPWAELEARVAACTRCSLHRGRTQTVFGVGARDAEWFVVGEAPVEEEDQRGEPFVGAAGQLLDAMMTAIYLPLPTVFIANLLKCRPPENRDPQAEEIAECSAYLASQIELVRPRIILAFGRVAAQNLLGTTATLASLRGVVHHYGAQRLPVVVTYHPAYLLRSPGDKRKAWEDLKFARRTFASLVAESS
ncbi:MAG: hypothetical protein RL469_1500 [Pseudomonadota bacterium]